MIVALIGIVVLSGGAVALSGRLYARRAARIAAATPYHPRHSEEPSGAPEAPRPLDSEADADAFVGELRSAEHESVAQLEAREWTDADYATAFSSLATYLDGYLSRRLPLVLPADVIAESNLYAFRKAEEREAVPA